MRLRSCYSQNQSTPRTTFQAKPAFIGGYSKSEYKALYDKINSGTSEPQDIENMCKIKGSDDLMFLNEISPQEFPLIDENKITCLDPTS